MNFRSYSALAILSQRLLKGLDLSYRNEIFQNPWVHIMNPWVLKNKVAQNYGP
jgi:hypothetical protein